MATNVSLARVNRLMDRVKSLQHSKANAIKHAKRGVTMVADAAVVNSAAFGVGVMQGRLGEKRIFGIPAEILIAGAFHGAGLMDVGGRGATDQLHNLGNGALAAYTSGIGRGVGKRMRTKAGLPALSGVEKVLDALSGDGRGGGGHDDEELMRVARRL